MDTLNTGRATMCEGRTTSVPKEIADGYKWPSRGDRLLRADDDWEKAVSFEDHPLARDVHIWEGYMRAGAALVDLCEQSGDRLDRHELVYPILFCYRHALELAMKWIVGQYGRYADVAAEDHLHHDLWKLWAVCKKVIVDVGSDGENEELLAVEQVVKDFHDLDKGSFSFRYSRDRNGMTIQLPNMTFDLSNIKNVMEAVNNLFTGADGQLDHNSGAVDWYNE
jgi:hypothetical protein